jgi:hypothetical protein
MDFHGVQSVPTNGFTHYDIISWLFLPNEVPTSPQGCFLSNHTIYVKF